MRYLLQIGGLAALFSTAAFTQVGASGTPQSTIIVLSDSGQMANGFSGAGVKCTNFNVRYSNPTTGHVFSCQNPGSLGLNAGTWQLENAGGGGGGGTVPAATPVLKSDGNALVPSVAGTDYQAPIAANTYAPYSLAVTPDALLTTFQAALQSAGTTPVNVVILGDSESRCFQGNGVSAGACPNTGPQYVGNLYVEQLKSYLQARYGNHGTGMIPIRAQIYSDDSLDYSNWTLTGTHASSTTLGPYGNGNGSLIQFSPGATAALAAKYGDTFRLYCATGSDNSGWTVSSDGSTIGSAYCAATGGGLTAAVVNIAIPAGAGSHAITLTANGTGHSYLYAGEMVNGTSGVSVHNVSMGACKVDCYTTAASQTAFSDIIPGGAKLVIIPLGTNEVLSGGSVSTSTFQANMQTLINHEKALSSAPNVIAMTGPVVNPSFATEATQKTYVTASKSAATATSVPFYDVYSQLFVTYANEQANSLITADGIHLLDSGQIAWGAYLINRIFGTSQPATVSAFSTFNGGTLTNFLRINSTASPQLVLQNSNTSDFANINFLGNVASFSVGTGNSAAGLGLANKFYIYDGANSAVRMSLDSNALFTFKGTMRVSGATSAQIVLENSNLSDFANINFLGDGSSFLVGTGNSGASLGLGNKLFIYDGVAGKVRLSLDGAGSMSMFGTGINYVTTNGTGMYVSNADATGYAMYQASGDTEQYTAGVGNSSSGKPGQFFIYNTGRNKFPFVIDPSTDSFLLTSMSGTDHSVKEYSANSGSGLQHNWNRYYGNDGVLNFCDDTAGGCKFSMNGDTGIFTAVSLRSNAGATARPACASGNEGQFWYANGSGSTSGVFSICQNTSGTYGWVNH